MAFTQWCFFPRSLRLKVLGWDTLMWTLKKNTNHAHMIISFLSYDVIHFQYICHCYSFLKGSHFRVWSGIIRCGELEKPQVTPMEYGLSRHKYECIASPLSYWGQAQEVLRVGWFDVWIPKNHKPHPYKHYLGMMLYFVRLEFLP